MEETQQQLEQLDNTAGHTPTPWEIRSDGWSRGIVGNVQPVDPDEEEDIAEVGSQFSHTCTYVASVEGNPTSQIVTQANARRIVACVNACAGIPTEALERAVSQETTVGRLDALRDLANAVAYREFLKLAGAERQKEGLQL